MKVVYDEEHDILYIRLNERLVRESDEIQPGVMADIDDEGRVVGFEILDASELVQRPITIDFQASGT